MGSEGRADLLHLNRNGLTRHFGSGPERRRRQRPFMAAALHLKTEAGVLTGCADFDANVDALPRRLH